MKVLTRENKCIVCGSSNRTVIATGTDYQYKTTEQLFDWCSCTDCGHHYINPIPTEEALRYIYPATLGNYDTFDAKPSLAFRIKAHLDGRRLRLMSKSIPKDGRLLDIGCAAGTLLDVAKSHCSNLRVLEGLDISESATRAAVRKGYRVYVATAEEADLPLDYYDLIIMQQVIEHLHNPRAVMEKLRNSLRAGGRLIMETPHLGSVERKIFKGFWEGYHIPRHFNLWTTDGMYRMLSEAGYSSVSHCLLSKPVHWTISLQNIAIAKNMPKFIVGLFSLSNPFPLFLIFFGVIDAINLKLFNKASGVQYIAVK